MREKLIKKQWLRKGIAMVIALAMVAGILPVVNLQDVFAAEGDPNVQEPTIKYGTVTSLSGSSTITNNQTDNVVNTVISDATLQFIGKDTSIGRNYDGWWFGIKITAPDDMLTKEDFVPTVTEENPNPTNVTYQNFSGSTNTWSAAKSFWNNQDSDKGTESCARWLGSWGYITPNFLDNAISSGTNVTYKWRFDWNKDGEYEQVVTLSIDPSKIILMKDSKQVYPRKISKVDIQDIIEPEAAKLLDTDCRSVVTGTDIREEEYVFSTVDNVQLDGGVEQEILWKAGDAEKTGTAEYDTAYTVNVKVKSKLGYAFEDSVAFTLNGTDVVAQKNEEDGSYTVSYTFGATDKLVSNVVIKDLTAPKAGEALDTEAVCDTTTINVTEATPKVEWKVDDKDASGKAGYGKAYTAYVTLSAKDGFAFGTATTAKVGDKDAKVTLNDKDNTITVSFTYDKTEELTTTVPDAAKDTVSNEVAENISKEVANIVEDIINDKTTTVVDTATATEIKKAVSEGKTIKTEIVAEKVEEKTVAPVEVKAITESVKALEKTTETTTTTTKTVTTVAQYINVEILVKTDTKTLGTVSELNKPIELKIAIPQNLKADSRKFFVVRFHDGKVEKLDSKMNADGTLTFTTDKFSTYALAYEDTVVTQKPVVKPVGKTKIGGTKRTSTSVTIPWSKVTGATKYRVYYKVNGASSYKKVADTTSLKYTIKGLKSATTYKFAVKAYGNGKWSDELATKVTTTSPSKVAKPTVKAGSRKATVKYKKVSGATGYEIYMAKGNGKYKKVKTTKSTSYTKTGLTRRATYKFKVRAYKKVGSSVYYGSFSSSKSVKVK